MTSLTATATKPNVEGGSEDPDNPFAAPRPLAPAAYHGIIGKIAKAIDPTTEADPAAVFVQLLVAVGNAIGRNPHALAEADRHGCNENAVIVGETAKARKGTSWGRVREIMKVADAEWTASRIKAGLGSGEGLIHAVRDAGEVPDGKGTRQDPGVFDKRLLIQESEFASVLGVNSRQGNNVSPILRLAWDSVALQTLTKNTPEVCAEPHISLVGHITRAELLSKLTDSDMANGFGNRILWTYARRSKFLPEGLGMDAALAGNLGVELRERIQVARKLNLIVRDPEAKELWAAMYELLTQERCGLLGMLTARAEAHVLRISVLFAALDGSQVVKPVHLEAASAVWKYAAQSAAFIFGDALGNPAADRIMRALRNNPEGLSRTDISRLFSNHPDKGKVEAAFSTPSMGWPGKFQLRQGDETQKHGSPSAGSPSFAYLAFFASR